MPESIALSRITNSVLLRFVHKALANLRPTEGSGPSAWCRISELLSLTSRYLAEGGFIPDSMSWFRNNPDIKGLGMGHPLLTRLSEGYHVLLRFGYVVPVLDNTRGSLLDYGFQITETGKRWIADTTVVIPEDADEYIAGLHRLVPELDAVVLEYISQALVSYNHQSFFAAAVMVGAASEKLLYLMTETLKDFVKEPAIRDDAQKSYGERSILALFRVLLSTLKIAQDRKAVSRDLRDNADLQLLALQDGIRCQRNDAVHPQTAQVDQQQVFMTLHAFPTACRKAYDLIAWLRTSPL